jgi:Ca-activated chloride channel family protein
MSFDRPILLLTLLVVPLTIAVYLLAERRRMRYAVTFTNLDVLASVAGGRSARRFVPPALFLLALTLLCFAVARPQRSTLVASDKATVILVVDVSGSMHATDVKPSRLGAAQAAVRTFLEQVPKRVRVGLIAFSSDPARCHRPSRVRPRQFDVQKSVHTISNRHLWTKCSGRVGLAVTLPVRAMKYFTLSNG